MIFAHPAPRWFSVAAHRPFLDDLAAGLTRELPGAEALADAVVLTPTRRGARALAEAFVKAAGGRAVLLPQVRALGDLEEGEPPFEPGDLALDLPAAVSPLRRRFELARLVLAHAHLVPRRALDANAALELADALAGLIDSAAIEEVAPAAALDGLVPDELARHWQVSADFLRVALSVWPERLAELGLVDLAARRTTLLRALAARWRDRPPERPLIAAGSTGSAPATADLLAVIAAAPNGAVVLPGLDLSLADDAWAKVVDGHPQATMKRLIEQAGAARAQVRPWPGSDGAGRGRWRERILNEALRPAEATDDWVAQIARLREEGGPGGPDPIAEGLQGLSVLRARNEEEASAAIALLLREALETPGRTAALVTPDQALARRVSAQLRRWEIKADASAGTPLAQFPVAVLIANLARATAEPLDPARTLAILKHRLARFGWTWDRLGAARRVLERHGFRGPRRESWTAILGALDKRKARALADRDEAGDLTPFDEARALGEALKSVFDHAAAPFARGEAAVPDAARALVEAVQQLAADEKGDTRGLWAGPEGEAAAALLASLIAEGAALPPATPAAFADILDRLLEGEAVRDAGEAHPRLRILGAIEARLVRADRLVLAGLEEGVWPRPAATDPFLSRPMRASLGLPPPERRLGLSAHDFAQAACAPEVTLVHMDKRGGQPAVESRWLWRLRTLAGGAQVPLPERREVLDWARTLDAPLDAPPPALKPARRPNPRPPIEARPTELPVTSVERWVRDPYALYASRVLALRGLDRPGEPVDARLRGDAVHKAFERFTLDHPEALPDDAEAIFRALLVASLRDAGIPEPQMARETALAESLAPWVIAFERDRRRGGAGLIVEKQGRAALDIDGEVFTLTAKADRLELRAGGVDILDFKTGRPPSQKQVDAGLAPQLTLTAAILARGGFQDVGERRPGELVYVRVNGTRTQGAPEVRAEAGGSRQAGETALEGLYRRVRAFRDPHQGYLSRAALQFVEQESDHDHLARLFEWHVMGDPEEAPGAG